MRKMAKLYFKYGTMASSKSANLLMAAYNYTERGQNVLLSIPKTATRDDKYIKSRIGLKGECVPLEEMLCYPPKTLSLYDCIFVDEAQFATASQIEQLAEIVDNYNIPVICYGLKTDFRGELFEGSKRLFELADKFEEVKTICWCGCAARFNAKIVNGRIDKSGSRVDPMAQYIPLCRKHYRAGKINP